MKRKCFFCIFMMYVSCIFAQDFAFSDNQLLYKEHWVYKALSHITLESGLLNFASASPLSVGELKVYFSEINPINLSEAGRLEYKKLQSFFENQQKPLVSSGVIKMNLNPLLQPQFFFKTNEELPWLKEGFNRDKFLLLPLQFAVADFSMMELQIYFAQNYSTTLLPGKWSNIPVSSTDTDVNFPQKGYISFSAKKDSVQYFNLQGGMGPFSLGETQLGSIIFSDNIYYPGYFSYSLFSPAIKFATGTHQLETNKYLYSHRLEFRFFKRITLRLVEGALVYAPLDLRYLNPISIFHGLAGWRTFDTFDKEMGSASGSKVNDSRVGSYFGALLDINPWKNLRFYGIFAMNQFQTIYELEHYNADYIPNGLAAQGGFEGIVPYKNGYFYAKFEGLYTSPWMYICAGRGWSFYQSFRDLVGSDCKTYFVSWVGTDLGPDTLAFQTSIGYECLQNWGLSFVYRLAAQGENNKNVIQEIQNTSLSWYPTNKEEVFMQTPSGIPEITHRCILGGFIYPYSWLQLKLDTAFIMYNNYKNVKNTTKMGFEIDFGVKIQLLNSLKNIFQGV